MSHDDDDKTWRYRNASSRQLTIYPLGVVVESGAEFQSPYRIFDANFELIPKKQKRAGASGKEED